MTTFWRNDDGLTVQYGTRDDHKRARKVPTKSMYSEVAYVISGTDLEDAVGADDASIGFVIPAGAHITEAFLYVTTAFTSGGSAVLDIGVYKQSDGTAVDDDGIDSGVAVGSLTDNAEIDCDGALVNTTLANDSTIHASYDTAAFTAGQATLVIKYFLGS